MLCWFLRKKTESYSIEYKNKIFLGNMIFL
jgi:hypothetical protein